jgi:hypothetical protein
MQLAVNAPGCRRVVPMNAVAVDVLMNAVAVNVLMNAPGCRRVVLMNAVCSSCADECSWQ